LLRKVHDLSGGRSGWSVGQHHWQPLLWRIKERLLRIVIIIIMLIIIITTTTITTTITAASKGTVHPTTGHESPEGE
jgi:heme/copper-type cytochrome/quinol oxidase subunit 2